MKTWALIPGYAGLYRVSSDGIVQSCASRGRRGARGDWVDLSLPRDKHGYDLVYLWNGGRARLHVHRLVAEQFVPREIGRDCVNHINGIKHDNRAENLEWCTREENMRHAWKFGLCRPNKLTADDVRKILSGTENDTVTARIFGVSQVMVTRIRARKAWRHIPDPNEEAHEPA